MVCVVVECIHPTNVAVAVCTLTVLSDLTCQNQSIAGAKRKLESEIQTLHVGFTFDE